MKGLIFIFFCLTFPLFVNSQTNFKLDSKNGFKDFQIGDSFSKWSNDLTVSRKGSNSRDIFTYTGSCCRKVFDYNAKAIELEFKNSKLITIYITLEQWEKPRTSGQFTDLGKCFDKFENIRSNFVYLFGEPAGLDSNEESGSMTLFWLGRKIALSATCEYEGISNGCKPYIIIGDMTAVNQEIDNGF